MLAASIITALIALMIAANASETSGNIYHSARRNNPEDTQLHARHRENLKCHHYVVCYLLITRQALSEQGTGRGQLGALSKAPSVTQCLLLHKSSSSSWKYKVYHLER
jgi:hypothetical protein